VDSDDGIRWTAVVEIIVGGVVVLALVLGAIFGIYGLSKGIGRAQARADAKNRVKISATEIQNQKQRVEIAKQQAEIRLQDAIGVRGAQDEIAKTLTPLYVQFEMVDALKQIAASGKNNSIVFIPAGANGIPLVFDPTNAGKVGVAQEQK
jgi:hypothetical protein